MTSWISVKDKLPHLSTDVLMWQKGVIIPRIGFYVDGSWWDFWSDRRVQNVTHWMPLPEPPQ